MKKCSVHEFEAVFASGEGCQVIDVREAAEYGNQRIQGVSSIPLSKLKEGSVKSLRKDKPLYIFCQSGNRACKAADQLEKFGFSELCVVDGGLTAWTQAGKSVVAGPSRVWSLERQVRFAAGLLVLAGIILSKVSHPYWLGLSVFVAAGLIFAAVTNTCGMAMVLAYLPWNQRCQK